MKFEYRKERSDILGIIYRPIIEVEFINTENKIEIPEILYFDSGADITLIPRSTGELLGFEVKDEDIMEIRGVGGGIVPVIIMCNYACRKIFSMFFPFANSSTNLSRYLTCFVNGVSISSIRYPHINPVIR